MIGIFIQDTIKNKQPVRQDTIRQLSDYLQTKKSTSIDSSHHIKAVLFQPAENIQNIDTSSLCCRNSIADVTFCDTTNIIRRIDNSYLQDFPFIFTGINQKIMEEKKTDLVRHLKGGDELALGLLHNDWSLPLIFFTIFIYGIIKSESGKYFKWILKFISFRGINESASRDIGALFQWQSTLFNLGSFINISLFVYFSARWYNVFPFGENKFINWLLSFLIIISALTIRHLVCIITGSMSGEKEIFREYLTSIYYAYRLAGMLLLIITVLILYTTVVPVNILFFVGLAFVALIYFIRVFRLFLIFINRHVSIFYLILYLCALEILPVAIIVKYVTGLI
jgi:Domain of unknown function (DUF4271)